MLPLVNKSSSRSSRSISTHIQTPAITISPAQDPKACQLAIALAVSDPRFDLSIYGAFLKDIPRRIGSSSVLDAATSALVVTLPLVASWVTARKNDQNLQPTGHATVPMLQQYGRALNALRSALSNPIAAKDPNTLCALYLIVITQGWLQQEAGHFITHGEGVCMILRSIGGNHTAKDAFEKDILSTLYFLVIMEGFINPRIRLDDDLGQTIEIQSPVRATDEPFTIESLRNHFLFRVSKMVWAPDTYVWQLVNAYHRVRSDRLKLVNLLETIPLFVHPNGSCMSLVSEDTKFVHIRWLSAYAMLTLVAMRIGAVLTKMDANLDNVETLVTVDLPSDFQAYNDDIVKVAEQALQYYPLGSSFMPLCLLAAYSSLAFTGSGFSRRAQIVRIFSAYRPGLDLDQKLREIVDTFWHSDCGRCEVYKSVTRGSIEKPSAAPMQSDLCTIL